uniref:Uncharacterized protein n=1 Tax=Sphaerodactylus townsendi TaxID=933632 RepID=A0ACB8FH33_9SAUR
MLLGQVKENLRSKCQRERAQMEHLKQYRVMWKVIPNQQYNGQPLALEPLIIKQTEETKYVDGKFSSKIKIAPEENVTLTCIAENQLERTITSLNVSAINFPEYDEPDERNNNNRENVNDQAKLIVGIVVGLLLAALVAGVAYWLYVKKSKNTFSFPTRPEAQPQDVSGESEKDAAQNVQNLPRQESYFLMCVVVL